MSDDTNVIAGSLKSNHPLFVAASKEVAGVAAPGLPAAKCAGNNCTHHSYDWREIPGDPKNSHGIRACFHQHPIGVALATRWTTEAHFCSYALMRDGDFLPKQPRLRKCALPWLRSEGYEVVLTTFMADVDTPGHVPWTAELRDEFKSFWKSRPDFMRSCGLYLSGKGYRLVQPIADIVPVEEGEDSLHGWLQDLVAAGVWDSVLECKDWTRLMRTPNYSRKTRNLETGEVEYRPFEVRAWSYDEMRAIPLPKNKHGSLTKRSSTPSNPRAMQEAAEYKASVANFVVPNYTTTYPREWENWVVAVGDAIRDNWVDGKGWREVFMCLAGALARNPDCDIEHIPALIGAAHLRTPGCAHLLIDRQTIAHHAIERVCTGYGALGIPEMSKRFPAVLEAHLRTVPRYFGMKRLHG